MFWQLVGLVDWLIAAEEVSTGVHEPVEDLTRNHTLMPSWSATGGETGTTIPLNQIFNVSANLY
jgi:hypothetical protein